MDLSMFTRRMLIVCLAWVGFMQLSTESKAQTLPTWNGKYTTATKQGAITYTPTRIFPRIGSGGWVRVDGVRYWGVVATNRGVTGMTWYYGTNSTGPEAGRATLTLAPDGSFSGNIQFTDRKGVVIGEGTVIFVVK